MLPTCPEAIGADFWRGNILKNFEENIALEFLKTERCASDDAPCLADVEAVAPKVYQVRQGGRCSGV